MIRSSESSRFPLAIVNWLANVYPDRSIIVGYDIGCTFGTSLAKEPSISPKVKKRISTGAHHFLHAFFLDWPSG
jgi:hypothetical protein